jgi:hypothetical protein
LLARGHSHLLLHTGQHYDEGMSTVFFRELGLPEPDINLGVSGLSHGAKGVTLGIGSVFRHPSALHARAGCTAFAGRHADHAVHGGINRGRKIDLLLEGLAQSRTDVHTL